jgi:hypothetical protein
MKSQLAFAHPDGSIEQVPCVHLQINDEQQAAIIGFDFEANPHIQPFSIPGVEVLNMGKLDDILFIFKAQLTNSLIFFDWDFHQYPSPHVILLAKISFSTIKQQTNFKIK